MVRMKALFATIFIVCSTAISAETYTRAFEGLRVRATPSLNAKVVGIIPYGQKVNIMTPDKNYDKKTSEVWSNITWGDLEGWVYRDFLSSQPLVPYDQITPVNPSETAIAGTWYSMPPFLASGYSFSTENLYEGDPLCYPTVYGLDNSYKYSGFEYYEKGKWTLSGSTVHVSGEAGFFKPSSFSAQYDISLYRLKNGIYIMETMYTYKNGDIKFDYYVKSNL